MRSHRAPSESVSGSMIFNCSMIEPGRPMRNDQRQRVFVLGTHVHEMNVLPVDFGRELWYRV